MKVIINKLPLQYVVGDLDKNKSNILRVLYLLALISIIFNISGGILYSIKAFLIFIVSIIVSKETEILFLTMKFDIKRSEAVEALKVTTPEITGLIFAFLLPIGTPLFVVVIGSFISIFVGKMIFGGYSFNIFNPAIVGRLFVGSAWPGLVTLDFSNVLDNNLLKVLFNNKFNRVLATPLIDLRSNGIISNNGLDNFSDLLVRSNIGMLFSVPIYIYLIIILFFVIIRPIDFKPLIVSTIASLIILSTISINFNLSYTYVIFHILNGGFLFITIFMMTDPFTKPFNSYGVIFYSVIFVLVYTLIRFLGRDPDGTMYALLFSNIFVPLLNKKTKDITWGFSFKSIITILLLIVLLIGTGLFINSILNQRIINKDIVVIEYAKN